jgi:ComF family protein
LEAGLSGIKALAKGWAQVPLRLLFPPVCAGCRRIVSEPAALCARCWPRLRFLERPWCAVMGTPFPYEMGDGFLSAEAIAKPPPFGRARAAVAYEGVAGRMAQALKYGDRTDLAPWMARWMRRAGSELLAEADMIVPVPLHWRRFWTRRFNQSAELGRALAALSGVAFAPQALARVRPTRRQVGLKPTERDENVRAAFRVPAAAEPLVAARRVLVVDDVYTTGATAGAAARALLKGGAAGVDVLTFARVLPHLAGEGDFRLGTGDLI